MKRRIPVLLLAALLLFSANAFAVQEGTVPASEDTSSVFVRTRSYDGCFSDVAADAWYYSSVSAAYEYSLVAGRDVGSGTLAYAPQSSITVAELITLSARLRSTYENGGQAITFPAAEDGEAWYMPYVRYIRLHGMDSGGYSNYDSYATRAQMAAIFAASLPDEWYDDRNASLVTDAYASRDFITDVDDYTPFRTQIIWMYKQGLLVGMDERGSFYPDKTVTRAEIAALLTRVVDPSLRLSPDWVVMPYHSAVGSTLSGLVEAPLDSSAAPNYSDTAAVDACIREVLSSGTNRLTLTYPSLTQAQASAIVQSFVSGVKSYCEQMYNKVNISYQYSGRATLTFSSTVCSDAELSRYRALALARAIEIHDSLWESGMLSYDMSEYEIARIYFAWLCDNCSYDNASTVGSTSLSHLAYSALCKGKAVCDGYTGAYNLLLKLEGISCTALFNADHIWTLATLDGVEYHIDTTWGDQYGRTDMSCFGMTAAQSRAKHPW